MFALICTYINPLSWLYGFTFLFRTVSNLWTIPVLLPVLLFMLLFCSGIRSQPTLPRLLAFPGRNEKINIPEWIGAKYLTFGILLLDDKTGRKVNALTKEYSDATNINLAILMRWLNGEGRAISWEILTQVLIESGLTVLAGKIKDMNPHDWVSRFRYLPIVTGLLQLVQIMQLYSFQFMHTWQALYWLKPSVHWAHIDRKCCIFTSENWLWFVQRT